MSSSSIDSSAYHASVTTVSVLALQAVASLSLTTCQFHIHANACCCCCCCCSHYRKRSHHRQFRKSTRRNFISCATLKAFSYLRTNNPTSLLLPSPLRCHRRKRSPLSPDSSAVLSKKAVSAFLAQNELVVLGDCIHHYLTVCKARKP